MFKQPAYWAAWSLTIACILISPYIQPGWVLSIIVILFSVTLFLIPETKYASISFIILAALYGTGWLPLFIFATTIAIIVNGEGAYRALKNTSYGYPAYIGAGFAGAFLVMIYFQHIVPLIALLGVVVAVFFKSALQDQVDILMIEGLGVAMTMYFFDELNYQVDLTIILLAAIVAFSFGFLSHRFRVMDMSGLFSSALIGIILIAFTRDVRWFIIMLTFLMLGSVATRYKYNYKLSLGSAQGHGGRRGYYNVFANGLVATAAAILFGITQHPIFTAMFLGSVATAAADTVAGEVGMTRSNPILITTRKPVPPGTNGGISFAGEIAGLVAAMAVLGIAFSLGVSNLPMLAIGVTAGFIGTNIDSLIGATLENQGLIGNAGTNLLATLFGGLVAAVFYYYMM